MSVVRVSKGDTYGYHLLNREELQLNHSATQVGMLRRVLLKFDKNRDPYLSIMLSDINGKMVFGCIFKSAVTEGLQKRIEDMLDMPVSVSFTANQFGSGISLDIENVDPLDIATASRLAAEYFRAEYPDKQSRQSLKFVTGTINDISDKQLRTFIRENCNLAELKVRSNPLIYDGMYGGNLAIITSMLCSAQGVVISQPDFLDPSDKIILPAAIIYIEYLLGSRDKQYSYKHGDVWREVIRRVEKDSELGEIMDSEIMFRFFEICQSIVWNLAKAPTALNTVAKIYLAIRECATTSHWVINLTNEIPRDAVIRHNNIKYTR